MRKPHFVFVFLVAVLLVWVDFQVGEVKAESRTLVVPDDFCSIQTAVDNATAGDTVFVRSGEYHENVVVNKPLSLVGENVDTTIIDGNPPEGYRIPIKIQADNVSVSGFKLLYGYAGISANGARYCSFSENRIAGNEHGIMLSNCLYCEVSKNYFELIGLSSAIQLSYSDFNVLTGNYIDNCTEGIQLRAGSSNNLVTENTVTNCDDVAIRLLGEYASPKYYEPNNNMITRNVLSYSGFGATIYVANNNTLYQNSFINNTNQISTNEWYAKVWGYKGSHNTISQNYWSNYNGTDTNDDGYGDTPYIIDEDNQDDNPIMTPIQVEVIPEFPSLILLVAGLFVVGVLSIVYRCALSRCIINKQKSSNSVR